MFRVRENEKVDRRKQRKNKENSRRWKAPESIWALICTILEGVQAPEGNSKTNSLKQVYLINLALEEKLIFLKEEGKSSLQKNISMEYNSRMEISAAGNSIGKLCMENKSSVKKISFAA